MHNRISLINETNNKLLYISKTTIEKSDGGFKAQMHSHPNLEIFIIYSGYGSLIYENNSKELKTGTLIFINPKTTHCEITSDSLTFYSIGVNEDNAYLSNSYKESIIVTDLTGDDYNTALSLYEIIYSEAGKDNNIIMDLFNGILKIIERNSTVYIDRTTNSSYSSLVSRCINIIDNYYYSNPTLKDLSKRLDISESLISHKFKSETGKSVIEYKIEKQLSEASSLLKITDMTIIEISFAVGFSNTSYFTKQFKKRYGITPKEYRKNR